MTRRRTSRRNPWASAKPANWGSMSRQERKAWNRANWQRTGGGSTSSASPKRASTTAQPRIQGVPSMSPSAAVGWLKDNKDVFHDAVYGEDYHAENRMLAMAKYAGLTPSQVMAL